MDIDRECEGRDKRWQDGHDGRGETDIGLGETTETAPGAPRADESEPRLTSVLSPTVL